MAQIGTDPRHAVVLGGLPQAVVAQLRSLDGGSTHGAVLARLPSEDRAAFTEVLAVLTKAGLVEDTVKGARSPASASARLAVDATTWALRTGRQTATVPSDRARAAVIVHGDGRIAVATACLLAAAGVGSVHVAASGAVEAADCGCGYLEADVGTRRARAAARALRRACDTVQTTALPAARLPDLVVLADAAVPDPQLVAALCAAGTTHLVARAREGNGWVGPMVVPGRTGCLRCLDLDRTDRDPCWPRLATQLAIHPQPADLLSATAVAAFAAGQVLRSLDGDRDPPLWNSMLELDPFGGAVHTRAWQPHPACECGAAAGPSGSAPAVD